MNRIRNLGLGFFSVVFVSLIWELSSRQGWIDTDLFPPLSQILHRLIELMLDKEFLTRDLLSSFKRLAMATFVVVPISLGLGLLAGTSSIARALLNPFVNFTLPLPKVAIFPLILAIFGLADTGKIILIGIGMFYPLFINVTSGAIRLRSGDLVDFISVYRIRGYALWVQTYGLGLFGDVIVGLKASIGYGFTLMIVSEMSASNNGLGNFIWRSWDSFRILDMYSAVVLLCALGWAVQASLDSILARQWSRYPPYG